MKCSKCTSVWRFYLTKEDLVLDERYIISEPKTRAFKANKVENDFFLTEKLGRHAEK